MISLAKIGATGGRVRVFQRKRCIVVDRGSTTIKILLAERARGSVEVLHALTVNLRKEGLLDAEEIRRHLEKVLDALGEAPIAFIVRQSSTISQLMDMGRKWPYNVKRAIREETQNLSGLSEKSILYDFAPMRAFGRFQAPYWVTIARENEVEEQLEPIRHRDRSIAAVTTPANSLINAFGDLCPGEKEGLLVDIGETSTTVALVENGQGIFATNIALGSEHLTEAIAEDQGCDYERAETVKREVDFFGEEGTSPALSRVLSRWRSEIDDVVLEWSREQGVPLDRYRYLPCWLSGGGARQPGLPGYLAREWNHEIREWPVFSTHLPQEGCPNFVIAYGTALSTLRRGSCPVNLLPTDVRRIRRLERQVRATYSIVGLSLLALLLLMVKGAGLLSEESERRRGELERYRQALQMAESVDEQREERRVAYSEALPFLLGKKTTRDLLETLAYFREISHEDAYWFVLLADGESYFGDGSGPGQIHLSDRGERVSLNNLAGGRSRFVAELCVPGEDEVAAISPLGDVVGRLRSAPFLWEVDTLPSGQRRNLVFPEATIPEETYTLTLEVEPFRHGLPERPSQELEWAPHLFSRP